MYSVWWRRLTDYTLFFLTSLMTVTTTDTKPTQNSFPTLDLSCRSTFEEHLIRVYHLQ